MKFIIQTLLAIAFLILVLCLPSRGQTIDSCINCNFMGLTTEQWEIKDAPFWRKIDSAAISRNGGLYLGDLPSQIGSTIMCHNVPQWMYCEYFIYHPSIDSTIVEKHYFIKRVINKDTLHINGWKHLHRGKKDSTYLFCIYPPGSGHLIDGNPVLTRNTKTWHDIVDNRKKKK